jgi:hypothetical protein
VFFSPSPAFLPAVLIVYFLDDSPSEWSENLKALLIFISLLAKHVEVFFMYLLVICISSFEHF